MPDYLNLKTQLFADSFISFQSKVMLLTFKALNELEPGCLKGHFHLFESSHSFSFFSKAVFQVPHCFKCSGWILGPGLVHGGQKTLGLPSLRDLFCPMFADLSASREVVWGHVGKACEKKFVSHTFLLIVTLVWHFSCSVLALSYACFLERK